VLNEFYRVAFRRKGYGEVESYRKVLTNGLRVIVIEVATRAKDVRAELRWRLSLTVQSW